ncbi:hypothetical protein GCM10010518_54210 [Kitasatospora cinereorecta]
MRAQVSRTGGDRSARPARTIRANIRMPNAVSREKCGVCQAPDQLPSAQAGPTRAEVGALCAVVRRAWVNRPPSSSQFTEVLVTPLATPYRNFLHVLAGAVVDCLTRLQSKVRARPNQRREAWAPVREEQR